MASGTQISSPTLRFELALFCSSRLQICLISLNMSRRLHVFVSFEDIHPEVTTVTIRKKNMLQASLELELEGATNFLTAEPLSSARRPALQKNSCVDN